MHPIRIRNYFHSRSKLTQKMLDILPNSFFACRQEILSEKCFFESGNSHVDSLGNGVFNILLETLSGNIDRWFERMILLFFKKVAAFFFGAKYHQNQLFDWYIKSCSFLGIKFWTQTYKDENLILSVFRAKAKKVRVMSD